MKIKSVAIFGALLIPFSSPAAETKRPNILFILVDDQAPSDFKFYNAQSTLDSPVMDRLASRGMVFESAVHMGSFSGAVCTPSRDMIMSGRSVWHLPISPGGKKCPPETNQGT